MTLPSIFLSHGAPTLANQDGKYTRAWAKLARELPQPEAIVVVSAHWDTASPKVSAVAAPETIHDFSGFPRELYSLRYSAPGAPRLAERVRDLLVEAGVECAIDPARGLDHGAWVPLRWMYPQAGIPVTQLSIQTGRGARHHYRIGQAIAPLRAEGVLVLGSGGIVHNLRELDWGGGSGAPLDWALAFNDWVVRNVEAGAIEELLEFRARAPQPTRAHPSEDHLVPFYAALGAGGAPARRIDLGFDMGSLGMDGYVFG